LKLSLSVSALLYPTESRDKVLSGISMLFPALEFEETDVSAGISKLTGRGDESNLEVFRRRLREQRILDAARSVFASQCGDGFLEFSLNKQVATVGVISFPASSEPLGSIHVRIEAVDVQRVIDWLAPPTEDGVPVFEIEL
jgi:hypothetical protein